MSFLSLLIGLLYGALLVRAERAIKIESPSRHFFFSNRLGVERRSLLASLDDIFKIKCRLFLKKGP